MIMNSVCLQMVSEKVGGAEGTKLDEEFRDLERVRIFFLGLVFFFPKSGHFFTEEPECWLRIRHVQ